MRARDYPFDIEEVLSKAVGGTSSAWEENFVEGLLDKFDDYGGNMYLSEKQATILCRIAGVEYQPPETNQWKHQQQRSQQRQSFDWGAFAKATSPNHPGLDASLLKRLISLCHPDKHGNSQMATEVTQQLLKMRKA